MFHSKWAVIVASVALAAFFIANVARAPVDARDPITAWYGAEAMNSPLVSGDDLAVRIWRDKVRDDCPVTSQRDAVDRDGRRWEIPDAFAQPGGPVGADYVDWNYPIPDHLPPGEYVLKVHLIYDCGRGGVFHHDQPDTRFRIMEVLE